MFVIKEVRTRPRRRFVALVFSVFWVTGISYAAAQSARMAPAARDKAEQPNPKGTTSVLNSAADPSTYRIGIEDELMISVWKEPELSQVVTVRPDGKITLPLLNDIPVTGLRTNELQDLLIEKFKPLVNEPQVTVVVRNIRSRKVYIVGKAVKQGAFPLNGATTMLQLLSEAGGLTPFAKAGSIHIVRKQDGKEVHIPFNYKKALSGHSEDPVLAPGDMVIIP